MNRKTGTLPIVVAAAALVLGIAHAGTKLVEKTPNPVRQEAPPRKILVLALSKDEKLRTSFEDILAGELALRGATAIASHASFPELPKDREAFEKKLVAEGFDAVTVTRMVGQTDKLKQVEGTSAWTYDYAGSSWWASYWTASHEVYTPGYLEKESKVRVRTELWRTTRTEGQLVWSGTSETVDPLTVAQISREIGAAVAKALAKAKII